MCDGPGAEYVQETPTKVLCEPRWVTHFAHQASEALVNWRYPVGKEVKPSADLQVSRMKVTSKKVNDLCRLGEQLSRVLESIKWFVRGETTVDNDASPWFQKLCRHKSLLFRSCHRTVHC